MTTGQQPAPPGTAAGAPPPTGGSSWALGLARFAGLAMALLGVLDIMAGTYALLRGEVTATGVRHAFSISVGAWGWIHIGVGILVAAAGMAVISGLLWGRVVGILLAGASLVVGFLSLSHHPGWSILGIALAVAVIWALCVFDEEAAAASPTMLD